MERGSPKCWSFHADLGCRQDWRGKHYGGSTDTHYPDVSALDACVRFYQRYCNFKVIDDQVRGEQRVVCMAESGRESEFVLQLFSGGEDKPAAPEAYHHFGFAVDSRAAVDDEIAKGREEGILIGGPEDGPFPTGYFCGLKDPNGNNVEISYGHLINPGG